MDPLVGQVSSYAVLGGRFSSLLGSRVFAFVAWVSTVGSLFADGYSGRAWTTQCKCAFGFVPLRGGHMKITLYFLVF